MLRRASALFNALAIKRRASLSLNRSPGIRLPESGIEKDEMKTDLDIVLDQIVGGCMELGGLGWWENKSPIAS